MTAQSHAISRSLPRAEAGAAPDVAVAAGRKLLLISYHFPPDAAVGAIRPAKLAKYLNRLGWKPYVLTVREDYAPVRDAARADEIAGLTVVRTRVWPTVLDVLLKLKGKLSGTGSLTASPAASPANRSVRPRLDRLKRYLNSVFELPDRQIGWLIPAVWAAYRLIKKERIELVVTSSPPRTTALIGLLLSYVARVRLVTDLRDPWLTPYANEDWFRSLHEETNSPLRERIERWLERKLLERSERVVTTNDRLSQALRQTYPRLPADRLSSVPNGYDAEDVAGVEGLAQADTFTLAYIGTFYLHRTPKPLFEAVRQLIREGSMRPEDIRIKLVGDVRSTTDGSVAELIESYGLTGSVVVLPPVEYQEALAEMKRSHLLLLFAPNQWCSVPAKTFEYLATGRPILCFAHDGATADVVRDAGAGLVVDPNDVQGIKAAVWRFFHAFKERRPLTGSADVSCYDRQVLSRTFSRLLADIT